ncbi:MAG: hypothetical protein GHCLOJNM_02995 [bacterium]|nr:hypothetical protein [bacterium]
MKNTTAVITLKRVLALFVMISNPGMLPSQPIPSIPPLTLYGALRTPEGGLIGSGEVEIRLQPQAGGTTITRRGDVMDIGGTYSFRLQFPVSETQQSNTLLRGNQYTGTLLFILNGSTSTIRSNIQVLADMGLLQRIDGEGQGPVITATPTPTISGTPTRTFTPTASPTRTFTQLPDDTPTPSPTGEGPTPSPTGEGPNYDIWPVGNPDQNVDSRDLLEALKDMRGTNSQFNLLDFSQHWKTNGAGKTAE